MANACCGHSRVGGRVENCIGGFVGEGQVHGAVRLGDEDPEGGLGFEGFAPVREGGLQRNQAAAPTPRIANRATATGGSPVGRIVTDGSRQRDQGEQAPGDRGQPCHCLPPGVDAPLHDRNL